MTTTIKVRINGKEIPLNDFMQKLFRKMVISLLELLKTPSNDNEIKTFEIIGENID